VHVVQFVHGASQVRVVRGRAVRVPDQELHAHLRLPVRLRRSALPLHLHAGRPAVLAVRDVPVLHLVDQGAAREVRVEGREPQSRRKAREPERARAGQPVRVERQVARQDQGGRVAQPPRQERVPARQVQPHRVRPVHAHPFEVRQQPRRAAPRPVERELHVVRVERPAVMELHALAQPEGPRQAVRRRVPVVREVRQEFAGRAVQRHEGVHHLLQQVRLEGVRREQRVEAPEVARDGHAQHVQARRGFRQPEQGLHLPREHPGAREGETQDARHAVQVPCRDQARQGRRQGLLQRQANVTREVMPRPRPGRITDCP